MCRTCFHEKGVPGETRVFTDRATTQTNIAASFLLKRATWIGEVAAAV
jgi:hypothetical protein